MSTLTDLFTNIANAIRAKDGSSDTIVASDFPTAIANIPTGDQFQFKQSIAPTHWGTTVSAGTDYTTTDNYGTWEIKAGSYDGRTIRNAFDDAYDPDGTENTSIWVSNSTTPRGTPINVELDFPILIKPQVVTLHPGSKQYDTVAEIYFSPTTNGNDWVLLGSLTDAEAVSSTVSITTSNFYRRMKIATTVGSSEYHGSMVSYYNIEITQGYWKEVLQ